MLFCCLDDLETADFITEEEKKLSGTTVIILIAFVFYLAMMIVIGAVYMKKTSSSEDYFLGGRGLNGWVAALSAQASDMSGWLLMGLPGAIYSFGSGQIWIAVGLFIGTVLNWVCISGRLLMGLPGAIYSLCIQLLRWQQAVSCSIPYLDLIIT